MIEPTLLPAFATPAIAPCSMNLVQRNASADHYRGGARGVPGPAADSVNLVNLVHQRILFALHAGDAALGKRLVHDAVLKAQSHDAALRSRVSVECQSVALMAPGQGREILPSDLHGHSGFCERVLAILRQREAPDDHRPMSAQFCLLCPLHRGVRCNGAASRQTSALGPRSERP